MKKQLIADSSQRSCGTGGKIEGRWTTAALGRWKMEAIYEF